MVEPLASVTGMKWEYPRPLMRRQHWVCLNGTWDFAFDQDTRHSHPSQVNWDREIQVPFSPETPASGIGETGFFRCCWYRRVLDVPFLESGQRLFLHFGAIDYQATVWADDAAVAFHEGGYTPFRIDLTEAAAGKTQLTIAVRADDDPADLSKPRGKQEWQLEPHGIWYPRTTGIWQTVWMETVSATSLANLQWTPNVEHWEIGLEARLDGARRDDLMLQVELRANAHLLARDTYTVIAGEVHRRIVLSDPGIDDYRNELLWSPSTPTLIEAEVKLIAPSGEVLDVVYSYTALRSFGIQADRFVLNGRPFPLIMVLDQGYWPEGGLTAPGDDALRRDVELAK